MNWSLSSQLIEEGKKARAGGGGVGGISRLFSPSISHPCPVHFILEIPAGASTGNRGLKGRPNRKLIGGRGGDVHKKYSRKVKLNEKNSCLPINPKKYSCYGLKKFIQGI